MQVTFYNASNIDTINLILHIIVFNTCLSLLTLLFSLFDYNLFESSIFVVTDCFLHYVSQFELFPVCIPLLEPGSYSSIVFK